jgi:hypothetical protein
LPRPCRQLPWLDVVDCDDGVAAAADELFELELVELVEPDVVPDDELDDVAEVVDDFVAEVVLDATDEPVWVDDAIAPVRASIPATLTTPAARRERRAGCGRRRLRDRAAGAGRRAGVGSGVAPGSVGWSVIGTPLGLAPADRPGRVSSWFR